MYPLELEGEVQRKSGIKPYVKKIISIVILGFYIFIL
jgi:hypothetical protein